MPKVRLIHWKVNEATTLIDTLRSAGHQVAYEEKFDSSALREMRSSPPDAVVIDLTRLPSHGREVAAALRGSKATRHIPLVFVDGVRERVDTIRRMLPDAEYTERKDLLKKIREAMRTRPSDPVMPLPMMQRYAGRTVAQKLGIQEGSSVAVIDPPRARVLPADVNITENPDESCAVTLWFIHDREGLSAALPGLRKLARKTKLWLLWRKGAAAARSGVTQTVLRASAISAGLVDYKICAVDKTWSAMLFAARK